MRSARSSSPAHSPSPWPFSSGNGDRSAQMKMRGAGPRMTSSEPLRNSARGLGLRLHLEKLEAHPRDCLLDDVAADIERWHLVLPDHTDGVPRAELGRQLLSSGFTGERAQPA